MMKTEYLTIVNQSEGFYKEKGSKFIAFAFPINSEEEVKFHVDTLRKNHPGACHVCYAYRLGVEGEKYRQNDDGEPTGTAGKPIYGQLLSLDLTDTLIAVVRYFGGTKLGTGGLIEAYKEAAKDALKNAHIVSRQLTCKIRLLFEYAEMNVANQIEQNFEACVLYRKFEESCEMQLEIPLKHQDEVINFLKDFPKVKMIIER
jgi:uncharacterized YigZ family protein